MSRDEHHDPFAHFHHLTTPVDDQPAPAATGEQPLVSGAEARAQRRAEREARRRRAHRRRRALAFVLVGVLVVGVGGFFATQYASRLLDKVKSPGSSAGVSDYPGPGTGSVDISVNQGDTGEDIATTLKEAGVVATRTAFLDAAKANAASASIQPGTYSLYKEMRAADALAVLVNPDNRVDYVITVPEGWTVDQVLARLQAVMGFTPDTLSEAMKDTSATGLPTSAGKSYEGWLSPGQYVFARDTKPVDAVAQMVQRTKDTLKDLGVASGDRQQVLTKASIAEREVSSTDYYGKVARVIQNRLDAGRTLQMDTIIAYGAGKPAMELTDADRANADNKYNVYLHTGLPPTPIANPGSAAIKATLAPPKGDWLYFITVNLDTGETRFTADYTEFQKWNDEYKAWKAENYHPDASTDAGDGK